MRKKVLCLENMPYQSPIRVGSHHYADHFSRTCDVLWISLPWHLLQQIKNADNNRYAYYNHGRPSVMHGQLKALTPFTMVPYRRGFPFGAGFIVDHYCSFMIPRIRRILKETGFDKVDLVWMSDPRHVSLLSQVRYHKLAYRCVDNLEHFPDVPSSLLRREIDLVRRCDRVFCTSTSLVEKLRRHNPRCSYLPNGADYDFFSAGGGGQLPERIERSLTPRKDLNAVYMGAVAEWFDFQALEQLALAMPRRRFIVVGPQRVRPPAGLRAATNVAFVGPIEYAVLPALLSRCAVGLIPIQVNPITNSVNPIKLFEYLAAGLEVVCASMKTARELGSPAHLYDEGGIIRAFQQALAAHDDPSRRSLLREYAKRNSWSSRFEQILKQVDLS